MSLENIENLKYKLKEIIIVECKKEDDFSIGDISDDEPLLGSDSRLGLDSLDVLQISMAIMRKYGVRIKGAKEGRIALASITALADHIIANAQ